MFAERPMFRLSKLAALGAALFATFMFGGCGSDDNAAQTDGNAVRLVAIEGGDLLPTVDGTYIGGAGTTIRFALLPALVPSRGGLDFGEQMLVVDDFVSDLEVAYVVDQLDPSGLTLIFPTGGEYGVTLMVKTPGDLLDLASCRIRIAAPEQPTLAALSAADGSPLPTTVENGKVWYIAHILEMVRFQPKPSSRGGLDPGDIVVRISRTGTSSAPDYSLGGHGPSDIAVHEGGDFDIELLVGFPGGDTRVIGRCHLKVITEQ